MTKRPTAPRRDSFDLGPPPTMADVVRHKIVQEVIQACSPIDVLKAREIGAEVFRLSMTFGDYLVLLHDQHVREIQVEP